MVLKAKATDFTPTEIAHIALLSDADFRGVQPAAELRALAAEHPARFQNARFD